ncbi:MAG: transporter substrate-binding domain-containing protein [Burkholderiaceae bacterium]|jgi:polar amino acid transport system substrate-binding protein|nr:transporter substrate-binding domain-containing protein [Burkholderiaceae bacterium]
MSPTFSPAAVRAFAPTGVLRACINLGNPILARREGEGVAGVSVDLAHELAQRLRVPCELRIVEKAAQSVEAVRTERADMGFFAIDPARSEGLCFTAPYVLIEGSYLVLQDGPLRENAQVDRSGVRVSVASGSAYDLFLTRNLQAASIVRVPHARDVLAALAAGQVDVAAGIRQVLEGAACTDARLRMLPGRFMVIEQAMGLPASRGSEAAQILVRFIEAMKASGFVAEALARHHIEGASVAPLASMN